jgi:murein DD-endopeptidase MepM/ murein hydrolase activator NlpD
MALWEEHYIEYRVKKGETLAAIGDRFHVSSDELAEINDIDDVRKIPVGLVLQIPFVEGSPTRTARASAVTAERGAKNTTDRSRASLGAVLNENGEQRKGDRSGDGATGKVNIRTVAQYKGTLVLPVNGGKLTSKFGWRWLKFHEGIDIAAPEGTKIVAAHSGHVVYVSENFGGYGKIVVVKGDRFLSVYAHNRRNRVSVGERVSQGEWIADVGQTGDATGSHLHFETRVKDDKGGYAAVDPMNFMKSAG